MELYCRKLSFFTHLLCHSKNTIFSHCMYLYFVLLSELKHLSLLSQYDRTLGSWSALLHFLDFISKENYNCSVFLDSHWRGRSAWTEEGVRGFSIRHPPSEASCPTLLSTCTCLNVSPAPTPLGNLEHLSTWAPAPGWTCELPPHPAEHLHVPECITWQCVVSPG